MSTVAVLSLKGGVGKTSVVLGLASAAARSGVRTLVVDLDPQCNATAALDPGPTTATLADVLASPRRSVLAAAITVSGWGDGVDVLVGAEETESLNDPDPGTRRLGRLANALHERHRIVDHGDEPYGLVLLDCPPSLGRLTRSALVAADAALMVTEPALFAVSGVQRAAEAVAAERAEHNDRLRTLGVVVNRVKPRSKEHDFRVGELRSEFGDLVLDPVLPDRVAVQQAQGACAPIHRLRSAGARDLAAAFDTLLGHTAKSSP
ncbi:ParA family protein [Amycolatopsis sp. CA-230715]|uniref:ParA family protein n=1 Tax=Amycolatopsis sp. CA-230715 TaxID=2745196 RepID=UPI001C00A6D2|nr:ParA family protein [Amycolatopsis sp. CA-230715]QWF77037.1 Chromosome partitioning protein ParA [Amycolatopsis sp. CA-230715]